MATTRAEISKWFDEGVKQNARYMLVRTDWFDHDDYPDYCHTRFTAEEIVSKASKPNADRVMEIYDLHAEKAPQLNAVRVWALNSNDPSIKPKKDAHAELLAWAQLVKEAHEPDASEKIVKPPTNKERIAALELGVNELREQLTRLAKAQTAWLKALESIGE